MVLMSMVVVMLCGVVPGVVPNGRSSFTSICIPCSNPMLIWNSKNKTLEESRECKGVQNAARLAVSEKQLANCWIVFVGNFPGEKKLKMRKQDPLIQEICNLHESNNVKALLEKIQEIVESGDKENLSILRLLTWPSPQHGDLINFSKFISTNGVTHIYSIGCGTGLLEWLILKWLEIYEKLEVGVTGIEIDFGWWSSTYSPPMFLPLLFVDKGFNCKEPFGKCTDLALFCYFNNLKVFLEYLSVFRGKYVAILGPISNKQFCEPAPLELKENPKMPCDQWKLLVFTPFGLGNVDHLAVYEKVN